MDQSLEFFILAAATAWLTTCVVKKDGPFYIVAKFRHFINRQLGEMSPLHCPFCTGPYVLVAVGLLNAGNVPVIDAMLAFFALLSVANALRGLAGDY